MPAGVKFWATGSPAPPYYRIYKSQSFLLENFFILFFGGIFFVFGYLSM